MCIRDRMLDLLKNRDQIDHIKELNDTTDKGLYLDNTPKPVVKSKNNPLDQVRA